MYRRKMFKSLLLCLVLCLPDLLCSSTDSLELLTGTLRSLQRVACYHDEVSLSCPAGTTINLQEVRYVDSPSTGNWICRNKSDENSISSNRSGETGLPCRWPNSMQYSLLQTVLEACQKKPQCKFATSWKDFVDPCPGSDKYVNVRFKCRPYEFRTKTGCEHDTVALNCNPGSRVAILEAQYGRNSFEAGQCPQPTGVPDEACSNSYATQTVIQQCHGKRRCEVLADSETFGSPCKWNTRTYLKIVYACVPLGVLDSRYESIPEHEELHLPTWSGGRDVSGFPDETGSAIEPKPVPPASNPVLQHYPYDTTKAPDTKGGDSTPTEERKEDEKESNNVLTFVYVGVAVAVVFVAIAAAAAVKFIYLKRTERQTKSPDVFGTDVPNVFGDGISDIDNDIDVSHISGTFYDPIHPDMILYREANRGSLRAVRPMSTIYPCAGASMYGNVDYVPTEQRRRRDDEEKDAVVSPKSLSRYSTSQFYYG